MVRGSESYKPQGVERDRRALEGADALNRRENGQERILLEECYLKVEMGVV